MLSAGRQGREKMLTATHVTELSAICDRLSGELALSSRVYCDVFRRKLMEWGGVTWEPNISWTKEFLQMCVNCKKPGLSSLHCHAQERRERDVHRRVLESRRRRHTVAPSAGPSFDAQGHRDSRANTRAHQIRFHCGWRNPLCTTN